MQSLQQVIKKVPKKQQSTGSTKLLITKHSIPQTQKKKQVNSIFISMQSTVSKYFRLRNVFKIG
jgi:hypothetical protein